MSETPRRLRGEQRDAQIRAALAPLAPGERPTPITAAAIVAAGLALINLVAMAAGATVHGHKASIPATIAFCAFAGVLAVGLWQVRYWAVIVFEALLAFALLLFSLLLLIASTVAAALICVAVIGLSGWLFWALVRPMARVQLRDRAVE
jgi:hypothetical protein